MNAPNHQHCRCVLPLWAVRPPRGIVSKLMAARRARAKRKPSEADQGIHRAIAAMQKPGRANEL